MGRIAQAEALRIAQAEESRIAEEKVEGWSWHVDPPATSTGLAIASTVADSEASSDVGYFSEIDDSAFIPLQPPFQGLLATGVPPAVHTKASKDEQLYRLCKNLANIFRDAANDPDDW